MKIVILGGSGQVGQVLARTFLQDGHDAVILVPGRLLQEGFKFAFPDWNEAAQDLCWRWRLL